MKTAKGKRKTYLLQSFLSFDSSDHQCIPKYGSENEQAEGN